MSNISMVEAKLPPGFRFHPRDEELVCDYLMKKLTHSDSSLLIDLDLNKCEPWDIPETACVGGKEWYFYAQRDRKYATGVRTNRATASGYWKATGKDRPVLRKGTLVGMRKTLVFYQGRAPKGKKTDWVMHEFRLQPSLPLTPPNYNNKISLPKEDWVLCRVFYKNREEILKGCMRSSCDDTGCSSSLPELMDSYISFEQPPPPPPAAPHHQTHLDDDDDHYEQVPCFSNLFSHHHQNQTNPNHNNNAIFNHMMTITSVNMDQPNLGATTSTTSTYGGGSASTTVLPNNSTLGSSNNASNCLDPFSCDRKVLKAVLTQLTKMEANPITHNHKASPSILPDHQATHPSQTNYFSRLSIPNLWNNY